VIVIFVVETESGADMERPVPSEVKGCRKDHAAVIAGIVLLKLKGLIQLRFGDGNRAEPLEKGGIEYDWPHFNIGQLGGYLPTLQSQSFPEGDTGFRIKGKIRHGSQKIVVLQPQTSGPSGNANFGIGEHIGLGKNGPPVFQGKEDPAGIEILARDNFILNGFVITGIEQCGFLLLQDLQKLVISGKDITLVHIEIGSDGALPRSLLPDKKKGDFIDMDFSGL